MTNKFNIIFLCLVTVSRQDAASGKVGVQEDVDADQQERVDAAEPGPEQALSDTGNPGSRSLFRPPDGRDAPAHPLTTHPLPGWVRACVITHTHTHTEGTERGSYSEQTGIAAA